MQNSFSGVFLKRRAGRGGKYTWYDTIHIKIFGTLYEWVCSVHLEFFPQLRVPIPFARAVSVNESQAQFKPSFPKDMCSNWKTWSVV